MGTEQQKHGHWHTLRRLADKAYRLHDYSDDDLPHNLLSTIPTPKSTIDREVFEQLAESPRSGDRQSRAPQE